MAIGDYPPEPLTTGEVRRLLEAADDGTLAGDEDPFAGGL
jgi:hypothetical protein